MILKIPVAFHGSAAEATYYTLFDTGSTYSCIRLDIAEHLGTLSKLYEPRFFCTASDGHFLKVEFAMRLDFEINDLKLSDEFMVVPDLSEETVIGATTMQKWRMKLDFDHDAVIIDPKVAIMMLKQLQNPGRIKVA